MPVVHPVDTMPPTLTLEGFEDGGKQSEKCPVDNFVDNSPHFPACYSHFWG